MLAFCAALLAVTRLTYLNRSGGIRSDARTESEDQLPLSEPSPLPTDDTNALRARLSKAAALREEAAAHPSSVDLVIRASDAAYAARDILGALGLFRAAARIDPSAAAYDGAGRCAMELGQFGDALNFYRTVAQREPHNPIGYLGMARALVALGRRAEAHKILDTAATSVLPTDLKGRLLRVRDLEQRGELARAFEEAQYLRRMFPEDQKVQADVARLLIKLLRLTDAQAMLENRVERAPDDMAAQRMLASVLLNPMNPNPNPGRAEEMLLSILKNDSGDETVFQQLGELYLYQERYPQAAFIYLKLLNIAPASAPGRLQFARALARLKNPKYQRMAPVQRGIGESLLKRERIDDGLKTITSQRPSDAEARLALAKNYEVAGRNSRALPEFEAAWALSKPGTGIRSDAERFCARFGITLRENASFSK